MAIKSNAVALKNIRERNYLARDFDTFRQVLIQYAQQYYPDQIQNFSEASLGGLLIDLAAYVGDNMSFYLDHLYGELNYETAVEPKNIETAIRTAGIDIVGASPATVELEFIVEVPLNNTSTQTYPVNLLPTLSAGSTFLSDNGIKFVLEDDVHFWESLPDGTVVKNGDVEVKNGRKIAGVVVSKYFIAKGRCTSGDETTDTFNIGGFIPFRKISLANSNVSQITSVTDGYGNEYYKVESLANDVVYRNVLNTSEASDLVPNAIKVIPAPYRFTAQTSLSSRKTVLTFGGGTADSLEDDVIPDPSEFAIPFNFSSTYSRTSINPKNMLKTSTLGVAASNTNLSITYRYGGGINHNVPAYSIRTASTVKMVFPKNPDRVLQLQVKDSLEVINRSKAVGGEDAPTTTELLQNITTSKNSQERIVTKEDLLARVYLMPSNLGRVFRASVSNNPLNPLATKLSIITKDSNGNLVSASNPLKQNLRKYLNQYRMVSDAIEIYDASVINFKINFEVTTDPAMNKHAILQSIISDLIKQFNIKNFHINQPIILSDIYNTIFTKQGVITITDIKVRSRSGIVDNLQYSEKTFDVATNTVKGMIIPPDGCIFELRYPEINIVGKAV